MLKTRGLDYLLETLCRELSVGDSGLGGCFEGYFRSGGAGGVGNSVRVVRPNMYFAWPEGPRLLWSQVYQDV